MRIVILGGGFAGVTLAQRLEREISPDTEIVLVSSVNHMVFSPMLADAVGRSVSLTHIVVPGRQMVKRTRWMTAQATGVDLSARLVHFVSAAGHRDSLAYDHLVLACGSVVDLDVIPGLAAYAYPLKSLGDAIYLGNDLIGRLEEASVQTDPVVRRRLLTVLVIGGGFSGVEVAGQIAELLKRTLKFYPRLNTEKPRIVLLQRGDRILPELNSVSLSEFACQKLQQQGVEVRVGVSAREVSASGAYIGAEERVDAGLIVCTIGNTTNPLIAGLGLAMERGRLKTGPDMRVEGLQNVWALGDCAAIPNAHDGKLSPPTAQFATRQAKQLASNLGRILQAKPPQPFSFKPLGILASLGDRKAVAEILGVRISGFPAWFLWRGIYLSKLPTFARKLEVAIDWAWKLFFPPNIVQLEMARTDRVPAAHYAEGDTVVRRGDPGNYFYVIRKGTAAMYTADDDRPVGYLQEGDHFGADPGGQQFTIRAHTGLDLLALPRKSFELWSESLALLRREMQKSSAERKGYRDFLEAARLTPEFSSIRVADVMSRPPEALQEDLCFRDVALRFHHGRPGYPVVDRNGKLTGYCGREELYAAMRSMCPLDQPVATFMQADPPCVRDDQDLVQAAEAMHGHRIEVFPVVGPSGELTGVLSPLDLFRAALDRFATP